MIDWMTEVMSAFKTSDQTYFMAVLLMDRYFEQTKHDQRALQLSELHITGVTCMFMASKYEDVYPLMMKTVFNKIGHKKISVESIRARELDILRVLSFKLGAPTPLEFLERYVEEVLGKHADKEFISLMSVYLAKMATHHENLCTKKSSLIGTSAIYVALKICEQMRSTTLMNKEMLNALLACSDLKEKELVDCSKKLLYLAQNFEKELPGLENLKTVYIPLLNKFVQ